MAETAPSDGSSNAPLEIYQLYASLRGLTPPVWRRLLVRADSTISDLHYTLQLAFGWSDSHLNRFLINSREYGVAKIGGSLFWDDPTEITLAQLKLRVKQRFIYEYDFYDHWWHELRLEKTLPLSPKKTYPICVGGSGRTPPEDCGGAESYMRGLNEYSLFHIDLRMSEIWDEVLDCLKREDGDIRAVFELHQDEVDYLKRWLERHSNLFDRAQVNQRLIKFATKQNNWWHELQAASR